jgi:small basic protein
MLGVVLAYAVRLGPISGEWGQYLAVGCLAGIDTILGGIRSGLEGRFRNDVFITGFIGNVLIAFLLAWLGDRIFINLFTAVALVFAMRIFNNLATIRRFGLTAFTDYMARRKPVNSSTSASAEEN